MNKICTSIVMITEDYVSFEISKLLKEKGFDVYGGGSFNSGIEVFAEYSPSGAFNKCTASKPHQKAYAAPTLQMAMKWLREVHNIHIVVHPYTDKEGQHWSFIFDKYTYGCWQELGIYITNSWGSYEEAVEAAIKYCLENLI